MYYTALLYYSQLSYGMMDKFPALSQIRPSNPFWVKNNTFGILSWVIGLGEVNSQFLEMNIESS